MKLLLSYISQHKGVLLLALFLAVLNQGFSLLDPQVFRILIDDYALKAGELTHDQFLYGILILVGASVGFALLSRTAKNFQDYFVSVMTQRVGTRLYAHGVNHSFSLPYSVFEDQRSGEVLRKLQKARDDSQKLIDSAIRVVFLSMVGVLFVVVYAFMVHWLIGLVYFAIIPVLGVTTYFISKKIKEAQKEIVKESADLAGSTTETLRNVELVKSLGLERQESKRLNTVNDKILDLEIKKIKHIRALSFLQGTLVNALRSAILLLMLWFIFKEVITFGQFFALLSYSFFIFAPLQQFADVGAQYQEANASMGHLKNILDTPSEEKPKNPVRISDLETIHFKNICFTYESADIPSVENITLTIKGGQTVAFVGPSGSGKTTLVKLVVGLYRPSAGQLLFNDSNSNDVDFEHLRQCIGLVSQETQLFAGTIRENLLFVNPHATDSQCLDALRLAAAETIISRNGQGLDTKIGEGGIKLSGGERQRLAIARALVRDPELIIFDEATSSLDSITEKAVTQTILDIEKSKPQLMTILVAHRLSTILHADVIYVLERGKIVEQGNHEGLLRRQGLYAALWREQSARNEM